MTDVVELCRDLIACASENPPGGEAAVADLVRRQLIGWGFEVVTVEARPDRPNVVGTLRRGVGRRLVLQAHSDTKPAVIPGQTDRWTLDPFRAVERDGLLYGLGACDTKGGLAAQLATARTLAGRRDWTGELVIQAVADEEDGSALGAEYLLAQGLLVADGAVVAEPTGCRASLAQLGNAWAEITITGSAAHAGTPERGEDAFRAALRYVEVLDALVAELDREPSFPAHPRLNVGDALVPGHPGTVPGECRLRCDIRVLPNQDRDDVLALYGRAAELVQQGTRAAISVAWYQGGGCQSHLTLDEEPIARAFRSAQQATGGSPESAPFAGGTDARYFAMAGTPSVVYGPGALVQAHAPDEFVPIAELHLAERHLTSVALAFLQDPSNNTDRANRWRAEKWTSCP